MGIATQAVAYGWRALVGVALTGGTIYVASNVLNRIYQCDLIEIVVGGWERDEATATSSNSWGVEPASEVRTYTTNDLSTTNPVAYEHVMTNVFAFRSDYAMLTNMDHKLALTPPFYVASNAVATTNLTPLTVGNIFSNLSLGDGTSQFTQVPGYTNSTGTVVSTTFGGFVRRLFVEPLQERYKYEWYLQKTLHESYIDYAEKYEGVGTGKMFEVISVGDGTYYCTNYGVAPADADQLAYDAAVADYRRCTPINVIFCQVASNFYYYNEANYVVGWQTNLNMTGGTNILITTNIIVDAGEGSDIEFSGVYTNDGMVSGQLAWSCSSNGTYLYYTNSMWVITTNSGIKTYLSVTNAPFWGDLNPDIRGTNWVQISDIAGYPRWHNKALGWWVYYSYWGAPHNTDVYWLATQAFGDGTNQPPVGVKFWGHYGTTPDGSYGFRDDSGERTGEPVVSFWYSTNAGFDSTSPFLWRLNSPTGTYSASNFNITYATATYDVVILIETNSPNGIYTPAADVGGAPAWESTNGYTCATNSDLGHYAVEKVLGDFTNRWTDSDDGMPPTGFGQTFTAYPGDSVTGSLIIVSEKGAETNNWMTNSYVQYTLVKLAVQMKTYLSTSIEHRVSGLFAYPSEPVATHSAYYDQGLGLYEDAWNNLGTSIWNSDVINPAPMPQGAGLPVNTPPAKCAWIATNKNESGARGFEVVPAMKAVGDWKFQYSTNKWW